MAYLLWLIQPQELQIIMVTTAKLLLMQLAPPFCPCGARLLGEVQLDCKIMFIQEKSDKRIKNKVVNKIYVHIGATYQACIEGHTQHRSVPLILNMCS